MLREIRCQTLVLCLWAYSQQSRHQPWRGSRWTGRRAAWPGWSCRCAEARSQGQSADQSARAPGWKRQGWVCQPQCNAVGCLGQLAPEASPCPCASSLWPVARTGTAAQDAARETGTPGARRPWATAAAGWAAARGAAGRTRRSWARAPPGPSLRSWAPAAGRRSSSQFLKVQSLCNLCKPPLAPYCIAPMLRSYECLVLCWCMVVVNINNKIYDTTEESQQLT